MSMPLASTAWKTWPRCWNPRAEFTVGDTTFSGADAFVGAFKPLMPVIVRNDIRKVFVDGDEAVVIYDFVTETRVGAVLSVEHIKVREGRIASSLLVFERLHWPEVQAELARAAKQPSGDPR